MFRVSQHPLSGVSKIVPAASGTGHTTCTATPLLPGLVWTSLYESSGSFAVNKYLHTVASGWTFNNITLLLHKSGVYIETTSKTIVQTHCCGATPL